MKDDKVESSKTKSIVAYFDFDSTLSTCDTYTRFLIFAVGKWRTLLKLPSLITIITKLKLGMISRNAAKEQSLTLLARGMSREFLMKKAHEFAHNQLNSWINSATYARLEYHLEHGHHVVIVSANLALLLNYWVPQHKIDQLIATEIEFTADDKCSGKLATANCYGPEKVVRIKQYLNSTGKHFDYSFGYGNSAGDFEMLDYADESYFINGHNITPWVKRSACNHI